MLKGYCGRLLYVDLTDGKISEASLPEDTASKFLGGVGIAARLLWDLVPEELDPFSADNVLVIMTGPFVGSPVPSSPKYTISTISPLTGLYSYSQASGEFGIDLKRAGYDGVVIMGRAPAPRYLVIREGRAQLKDAEFLWGMPSSQALSFVKDELNAPCSVLTVGPAGEKLVRFASVASGRRAHGRGGIGSVMGSKKLKAVAVIPGSFRPPIADKEGLARLARHAVKLAHSAGSVEFYQEFGTCHHVNTLNELGILPTFNHRTGTFAGADGISGQRMKRETIVKSDGCYMCNLKCQKTSVVRSGVYSGSVCRGPEYEALFALGSLCGNEDLSSVIAATQLCDDYGLDVISTGNVIAFCMELFANGILTKQDFGGLEPCFGDVDSELSLIRMIALRDGIGDTLAEGVYRASSLVGRGAERFAIHVKGQELPGYDPRGVPSMGLAYATASRGGCHLRAWTVAAELSPINPIRTHAERAGFVKSMQDVRSAVDACGMCIFLAKDLSPELLAQFASGVTGLDLSGKEFCRIGERIWNMERLLAVRGSVSRADDNLPQRFLSEPLPDGPNRGRAISPSDFNCMLDDYYSLRGWDLQTGHPTREKLRELDLDCVLHC